MVRLALAPDGQVVVDFRGKLPGRGAWAHPRCLPVVEQRPGMLKRGLKVVPPSGPWVASYREALERAIEDGLSMAAAAGALVGGQERMVAALRKGEVPQVILASDIAAGSEKKLRAAAGDQVLFTRIHLDTGSLGERVGKGPRAGVGVRSSRSATHLIRQLRRLRGLG